MKNGVRNVKDINLSSDICFDFLASPSKIKRKYHDHVNHKDGEENISELESNALNFLLDDCKAKYCENGKCYAEKDLLCLYHSIHKFMETGSKMDAFDIYYCVSSFYFSYDKAKKMVEMLSNFENNASTLVLSHRDHYSHSVYVYILGLAIFHTNEAYRKCFAKTYMKNGTDALDTAMKFLKYWSVTALFHDIGYPFEIPFEQIESYFVKNKSDKREKYPYISYNNMDNFLSLRETIRDSLESKGVSGDKIEDEISTALHKILHIDEKQEFIPNVTIDDIMSYHIQRRLNRVYPTANNVSGEKYIKHELMNKPTNPNLFDHYMDHAYFSASIIFRKLLEMIDIEDLTNDFNDWMDCLTAIVMHNSLFKFSLRKVEKNESKPLDVEDHPLAYLLMLCDELQCWDRTSFGSVSVTEVHATDCEFEFCENGLIKANYYFDKKHQKGLLSFADKDGIPYKIEDTKVSPGTISKFFYENVKDEEGKESKKLVKSLCEKINKDCETWMLSVGDAPNCIFHSDIRNIVNIDGKNSIISLSVGADFKPVNKYQNDKFSEMNMLKIYECAKGTYDNVIVTVNNMLGDTEEKLDCSFDDINLQTRLRYIDMVKRMGSYFDELDCFFTDSSKALAEKKDFDDAEIEYISFNEEKVAHYSNMLVCDIRGFSDVPDEMMQAIAGGYRDSKAVIATFFRELLGNASNINYSMVEVEVKAALEAIYKLPNVKVYYMPHKIRCEIVYNLNDEKKPVAIVKRALNGSIVEILGDKEFYYDKYQNRIYLRKYYKIVEKISDEEAAEILGRQDVRDEVLEKDYALYKAVNFNKLLEKDPENEEYLLAAIPHYPSSYSGLVTLHKYIPGVIDSENDLAWLPSIENTNFFFENTGEEIEYDFDSEDESHMFKVDQYSLYYGNNSKGCIDAYPEKWIGLNDEQIKMLLK